MVESDQCVGKIERRASEIKRGENLVGLLTVKIVNLVQPTNLNSLGYPTVIIDNFIDILYIIGYIITQSLVWWSPFARFRVTVTFHRT